MGLPTNPAALAAAVQARRAELGLTAVEVMMNTGLSRTSLAAIEAGTRPRMSVATLKLLDDALDWEPGTAATIYRTGSAPDFVIDFEAGEVKRRPQNLRGQLDSVIDRLSDEDLAALLVIAQRLVPREPDAETVERIVRTVLAG